MFDAAEMHRATVNVPDPRVGALTDLYRPEKISPASVDLVDIPGLEEGSAAEGRGSRLLSHIKEADVLIHVIRCFGSKSEAVDPMHDLELVDLELMAADALTLERKVERIAKRARAGDKAAIQETTDCQAVLDELHEGIPARRQNLSQTVRASIFECGLMSLKPVLYVANVASANDFEAPFLEGLQAFAEAEQAEVIVISGSDEADISDLPPEDRPAFLEELGLHEQSVERVIHAAYQELGLVDFFTAGEREVHVWTCKRGAKAPAAAGRIHTDMERGFIRMEVISYEDLMAYRSEEAAAKAGKRRLEGRDYEIQDGDVVVVRFSPAK